MRGKTIKKINRVAQIAKPVDMTLKAFRKMLKKGWKQMNHKQRGKADV